MTKTPAFTVERRRITTPRRAKPPRPKPPKARPPRRPPIEGGPRARSGAWDYHAGDPEGEP